MPPAHTETIRMAVAAALLLAGCTTVPERPGFDQVQTDVGQRSDHRLHWYTGTEEDEQAARAIRDLLAQELTAEQSVQIALLNNRGLQATYEGLSIAQADLVQAGLLRNPVFNASVLFPISGGSAELEFGVAQSFLEIFVIPLRRKVAESGFDEARIRVTGAVLDLAYETRTAFYRAQAASQRVEMFEQILLATELSHEFARRLREAGNITELELARQRDLWEAAKVKLRRAEAALVKRREVLNRLMGLFGEAVHWRMAERLPEVPEEPLNLERLESRALEGSLDLAMAGQRIVTAGRLLGVADVTALIPDLDLGIEAEYKGQWLAGPTLSLPIPLFDQGQARTARNRAELRQQQERYTALAIEIRSIAREARDQLETAGEIARHYQQVILPLRQRILGETQLQYNAMQVGLFELLRAREQQIEAGEHYIQALANYWTARAAVNQLLSSRMPPGFSSNQAVMSEPTSH
jgi:outer membrane protein, heavy metal efflux system